MISTEISMIREAWDSIADNFDRYVTPTGNWELAKTVLGLAGLKPDMKFLDVASGSGAVSLPAARLGAEVLALDVSPVMIGRLNIRAEEEGLSNLTARVMDGHHLNLNDNSFDMAGSQFGVTLFLDFRQGLSEMVRITQPGGTVFLVTFGPIQKVEFLSLFMHAVQMTVPGFNGLSSDKPPLEFQVSDKMILQEKMEEAGLINIKIQPLVHKLCFHSGSEMWKWVTSSNPIVTKILSGIDHDQSNQIRRILNDVIMERTDDRGTAILESAIHVGIGHK